MANGLLTQAEKPFFSLSMPLDQSMSRAESSPYQPQLPQSYEPYDLKSLVSNTFQAERDQIEQLTDMSEKFRQRAALTGNALERNRLNAQATIWENRATGLVEKIGEATTDDTLEELQGIFANLKKQGKLPQTESQYAQFMFNHGYNDKADHDAYKFVWSSFGSPSTYEPGTLFNKKGESQTYQTRAQEIKAREEGFNLTSAPALKEPETLWNHNTNHSIVVTTREQEVAARELGYDQTSPLADPTINPTLATSPMYTAASRKRYRQTGDASLLEEKPQEIAKLSMEDKFNQERALRNDFEKSTEEFRGLTDAYGRILVGAEDKSGLGDMTIIFNYMKMLDPTSTVREGEYASAKNTQGVSEEVRVMYNRAVDIFNGDLDEAEAFGEIGRDRFVNMTDQLFRQRFATYTRRAEHMTQLAKNYNLDVGNIVLEYAPIITDEQGNPQFIQIGARTIPYDPNVLPQALNSGSTDLGEELSEEELKELAELDAMEAAGG